MYTKEQIEDLLDNVLHTPKKGNWKGNKIQFCCTIHGESHPSCGIDIDFSPNLGEHYTVFHCFSCGESGSISWLVYKSLPDRFKSLLEAIKFLESRYGAKEVAFTYDSSKKEITLYETQKEEENRFTSDKLKLALFKSGKETYKYFFNRGFDKEDLKSFKIGRDTENRTVTIPCFYEDSTLAGVIGRYIDDRPKNQRYKIYNFPKGSTLFPLDHLKVHKDTIILVEGMFDCIMLHKWGITNSCAVMTNSVSRTQSLLLKELCSKVILLFDNDEGGKRGIEIAKKVFKRIGILVLVPTYFPQEGKDPCEWGEKETLKVINSANLLGRPLNLL